MEDEREVKEFAGRQHKLKEVGSVGDGAINERVEQAKLQFAHQRGSHRRQDAAHQLGQNDRPQSRQVLVSDSAEEHAKTEVHL